MKALLLIVVVLAFSAPLLLAGCGTANSINPSTDVNPAMPAHQKGLRTQAATKGP